MNKSLKLITVISLTFLMRFCFKVSEQSAKSPLIFIVVFPIRKISSMVMW